jgi:hypothetical protein
MDELVAKAIEIRREGPGLRIVGLVAEADAPEAQAFRETLPEASRAPTLQTLAIGGLDPHLGVPRELPDVAAQLARHEVVVIGPSAD